MNFIQNLTKVKKSILAAVIIIIMVIVLFFLYISKQSRTPELTAKPNNIYKDTLVVAADIDYEPYTFLDENGKPSGYDVEMIYALADAMHKNVEVKLMSWNDALDATKNGEIDLLLGLEYTPKDIPYLELSMPLHNDAFVAFGNKSYSNISTLYDKKLAALENSGSYTLFLTPYQLEGQTSAYSSYSDAFRSVVDGDNDYVIARYSVGRRAAAKYSDASIKAVGPILSSNDFCIGTALGNTELIQEVNSAIIEKRSDGTLDALTTKWLGQYVEVISPSDFIKQYKDIIIVIASGILLLLAIFSVYVYRTRLNNAMQSQRLLLDRAARDAMTQLFHKSASDALVTQIISDSTPGKNHAFFMVDIDNFKTVNDTCGHDFGDVAIVDFATALKNEFRDSDIICRTGGDEFAVFMTNVPSREVTLHKAQSLVAALQRDVASYGKTFHISGTIGVSLYPQDGKTFAILSQNADAALYAAKKSGKCCYKMFDEI